MKIVKTAGLALTAMVVIAGCSRDEEVMVMAPAETPIYAKDGTVIGMRPMVGHSGSSMANDATQAGDMRMGIPADRAIQTDDTEDLSSAENLGITGDDDDSDG